MWRRNKRNNPEKKENLMLELQQERALRYDAETKLEEMRSECDNCRSKVAKLQDDFKKMEDIVRGMLAYKARFDQMKLEKISAIQTYETKLKEYEMYIETLQKENVLLAEDIKALEATNKSREEMQEKGISQMLLQRVRFLEEQNTTLMLENTHQRHQYEQCLDDVANQVVQALLAQKTLREECGILKERVSDLEQQNKSLSSIFIHRMNDRSQSVLSNSESKSITFSPAQQTNCSFARYSFPGAALSKTCQNERIDGQQCQSDHSSESLASMCSDYSAMSSSSSTNAFRNHPGHPHPYSPPAWFHEVDIWPESRKTPSDCSSSFRSYQGCINFLNKQYNPSSYSGDDKFSQHKETYHQYKYCARDNKQGHINNLNHLESPNQNVYETVVRRHHPNSDSEYGNDRPNSSSSLHANGDSAPPVYKNFTPASDCNQSPSEFFDSGLDAVETPNDEVHTGDNLELSPPDPKVFKDKELSVSAKTESSCEQSVLLNSSNAAQRPTSLILPPKQHEEEINELKCLKCKNHEPNVDGNVYVEPNKSIAQVLNMCQVNSSNHQFGHSSNQNNFDQNQFINNAKTSTPIIHNIHVFANSSTPYFNNVSAESSELIGKDEGYSTMSSDVQGEPLARSAENAPECSDCDKHSSGFERKVKSFHDFVNKEEMKEICEEDESEGNCTNFARELASSIVKPEEDSCAQNSKLDPKSTRDLLSARSSKHIHLFSPQGFKPKNETSSSDTLSTREGILQSFIKSDDSTAINTPSAENNQSCPTSPNITSTTPNSLERTKINTYKYFKNYKKSDFKDPVSNLFRANSDSKICIAQKMLPSNSREGENVTTHRLPLLAMTCSADEVLCSHQQTLKTSMKRSQCQVLNRIRSESSCLLNKENQNSLRFINAPTNNEIPQDDRKLELNKAKTGEWIWEWEPLNSSEESSDLNGTDSGFFITSLPPLPKIEEDFKTSLVPNKRHLNNLSSEVSISDVSLLIGSSPELSRHCNSPDEKFKTSSLQRPRKKKAANVSPFKYYFDVSRTDMTSTPRLSWCSEELNLTGTIPPCDPLNESSSMSMNPNCLPTESYIFEVPEETCDKSTTEIEAPSAIASALDLETKFTSDFYRLCPADSNRSLTKSRNNIDDAVESRSKELPKPSFSNKNQNLDLHKNIAMAALKKQMLNTDSPLKRKNELKTAISPNKIVSDSDKRNFKAQNELVPSLGTKVKLKSQDQGTSISNPSSPTKKGSPVKSPTKRNASSIPVMKKSPTSDVKQSIEAPLGTKCKIPKPKEQKTPSPKKEPVVCSPVKLDPNKKSKESKIPTRDSGKVKSQANQLSKVPRHRNMPVTGRSNIHAQKSTSQQIEELNKMLSACGDSEEALVDVKSKIPYKPRRPSYKSKRHRKKKEGCVTSWVHVEADVDLSDPKARANLLDSMLASSSSSSDDSSDDCMIAERQHLHALHRFRRRKKRADFDKDQVIRYIPPIRPSIMNCPEFFYRYGEKEQEAVSYFDFLDEMSTSTPSSGDFDEDHEKGCTVASNHHSAKFYSSESSSDTESISTSDDKLLSPIVEESLDLPETCRHDHANDFCVSLPHTSQEDEINRISFSDSCAESFSSSDNSFTNVE